MTIDQSTPATLAPRERIDTSRHPYAHIVVALDGSALAERVLDRVEPLAEAFASKVTCVTAVEPISPTLLAETSLPEANTPFDQLFETQDEVRAEDITYLAGIKERLTRRSIEVECEVMLGRPAETIVDLARTRKADLIAMTTHGRSGLRRAVRGSVADEVVRTAPCPVLLVRIQAEG